MPVVLLVRHGRTTANAGGILAGRSAGVELDDTGQAQAKALGERLAAVPLAAVITSPLERCVQTATAVVAGRGLPTEIDERLTECDYGAWTGRPIRDLARLKLWRTVQDHPSAVEFPGGETMRGMQARAVDAIRRHDTEVAAAHGPHAVWVAVSHADVIKAVVADALGTHLDHFQRIVVDPASVTAISFTDQRPFVLRVNDTGGDLGAFQRPARRRRGSSRGDAVVGGGAGDASEGGVAR